ncbi:hypothetical protein QCA50_007052 [Cerrena zonata]|uniref:Sas10 C-terminal domain-containing protein n=1 Tax=Cerrena zonata TaxID=2478898 RepID=A0AAW0GGL9_9APHY
MPRRHGTKPKGSGFKPKAFNKKDSSVNRWNTSEDIPMDEEDRFHAGRDQILLGGEQSSEDEGDEDEIFALKGMPADSDSDESGDDDDLLDDDDPYKNLPAAPKDTPKSKKDKAKKGKKSKAVESDEDQDSEEEEEGWGGKKSEYYASNDAQIDSDDEEAHELEEQEAKRLQTKTRDGLADDDFGLDDLTEGAAEVFDDILAEPQEPIVQTLPQDKEGLLRHLEKTNPESLALARDWDDTARSLMKAQAAMEDIERENPDAMSLGINHLHYQALLTYTTTLAFYLHLRALPKYASRPDLLKAHPVMDRLLTLKQSIMTIEELMAPLEDWSDGDLDDAESLDSEEMDLDEDAMSLWNMDRLKGLEADELAALLDEANVIMSKKTKKKTTNTGEDEEPRPKKKRKTSSKSALPVFDLEEPTFPSSSKSSKSATKKSTSIPIDSPLDTYGEPLTLQASDALDKSARRKSLRFHTSKIENTINRRDRARNERTAGGGDDDIPYKEKKKVKEDRLKKEVEKARAREAAAGVELDDVDPEMEMGMEGAGKRRRGEDEDEGGSGDESGDDGYYELVKRQTREKKDRKKAEYDAVKAAERAELMADETANGPRSLTRAILKNKGLTPHRSKSVRNPRVKKRQRYEKAKKKVSSQKAVYKGGLAATGKYEGEKTGISKVIKSVRLS